MITASERQSIAYRLTQPVTNINAKGKRIKQVYWPEYKVWAGYTPDPEGHYVPDARMVHGFRWASRDAGEERFTRVVGAEGELEATYPDLRGLHYYHTLRNVLANCQSVDIADELVRRWNAHVR